MPQSIDIESKPLGDADRLGYQRIYEKSAIGIFRSSPDGRYIAANPAGVQMHGYASEDELLQAIRDVGFEVYVDRADREILKARLENQDSVLGFECEIYRHKTRERRWVRQNIWKVFDESGDLLYLEGHVEDITDRKTFVLNLNKRITARTAELEAANARLRREVEERKKAEAALTASETRFRVAFEAASDWYWEMDAALRYSYVSERFREVTGLDPAFYLGKTRAEFHGGDPNDAHWLDHKNDLDMQRPFRDFRIDTVLPNGDWLHFSVSGVPKFGEDGAFQGYCGTGTDITARVKAERKLSERETLLRSIVDNSPSVIVVKDLDGRFAFVNEAYVKARGGTVDEWIGKTAYTMSSESHAAAMRMQDREAIEGQKPVTRERKTVLLDGTPYHRIVTKFPVSDAAGDLAGVATISTDVVELYETRRALERSEAQLRQAQKMEVVGQLTGGVAHDFNNLLGVIVGNLDFLIETLADNDDCLPLADTALRAALRGADLTSRLLAFSRKQSLRPETTDLNALVSGMKDMLRRVLGETVAIRIETSSDLNRTNIDPVQLETALLNLAVNAKHAMSEGGELIIETANKSLERDSADTVEEFEPGAYVMLAVTDTGVGIPTGNLEHVFEPFFTTKEVGEGSGLGLSMVHGFVKQSGGHITIDSDVGKGTSVRLYLPLAADCGQEAGATPMSILLPRGSGERILIVEDDSDLRNLAVKMISNLGYQTLEASDSEAALAVLTKTPDIDLLFTDVVLPRGASGIALGETARKRWPQLEVLYTSGYTEKAAIEKGIHNAREKLLTKPYRREALAIRLRSVLQDKAMSQAF